MLLYPILHYNIITHCTYLPNSIITKFARIYGIILHLHQNALDNSGLYFRIT